MPNVYHLERDPARLCAFIQSVRYLVEEEDENENEINKKKDTKKTRPCGFSKCKKIGRENN